MISVKDVARAVLVAAAVCVALASAALAAVNIETVHVGNKNNAGELSGAGAGAIGPLALAPDRVCGAVACEYSIGKHEVTAGQYTEFLNKVAATDPHGLYTTKMDTALNSWGCGINRSGSPGSYTYAVAPDRANRPVNYVTWGDAARFANWLTNGQPAGVQDQTTTEDGSYFLNGATSNDALMAVTRKANARYVIPSEDEWYKAAYYDPNKPGGVGYWDYPTRTDTLPSNDVLSPDLGNNANFSQSGYTIGSPYYRTPVGEFENSASPYGTFDQGGNVWEWNEAIISSTCRGLRGGSWYYSVENLHAASRIDGSYDYGDLSTNEDGNIGFRVVEVPEQATLSLLALGGLVALRRRR